MPPTLFLEDEEEIAWLEAEADQEPDPLDPFFADGTLAEVVGELKSGKEGTVYVCRAGPELDCELVAAKVFRARNRRAFQNDAVYSEGRSFGKARENRAVKNKSRVGREIQFSAWLSSEWETLCLLHRAGADVPRPYRRAESAILMELIGDENGVAALLQGVRLPENEVRPLFKQAMDNIELFLRHDRVHGDLSAYNILYRPGRLTVIDFPQAVDPRSNTQAFTLLARDVDRICAYFMRQGMQLDAERVARYLWLRYQRGEL